MSKIFDGLKRTTGEIADLTNQVIDGTHHSADAAQNGSAVDENGHQEHLGVNGTSEEKNGSSDSALLVENLPEAETTLSEQDPEELFEPVDVGPLTSFEERELAFQEQAEAEEAAREKEKVVRPLWTPHSAPQATAIRLRAGSPLLPFDAEEAEVAAEEYRRVRTKILQHHARPQLMLISSPSPGDGKSVTAINIGAALALNPEARVLLVDTDLRRPKINGLLGLPEAPGLAEILAGTHTFEDTVLRLEPFPNLLLLPAGMDRANPTELISSAHWPALCRELRSQMTYVILDGPPLDAVAEYGMLQEPSDGIILVVRTHHTGRAPLFAALKSLPKDRLLGSVINSHRESLFWKQRPGYYS